MNIGYGVLDYPIHKCRTWIPLEIEEWKKRGHNILVIPRHHENNLMKEIKELDFMIIHSAKRARQLHRLGIPFLVITHAREIWVNNGKPLIEVSKSRNCKLVGYISSFHKEKFEEWGIKKDMVYTPVSIRTDLFTRTKPIGDKILCGARHIPKKGLDIAIRAVPNIYCWGEGPLTNKLKEISNKATFTGWLSNNELVELMNDSWLYIFPGIKTPDGDMDGQPTTIKEALAMELQVIATPIAGTRDLKYVKFVEPDVDSIRNAIESIEKKPNKDGSRWVKKNFHPSVFVDNVEKAIEEIL